MSSERLPPSIDLSFGRSQLLGILIAAGYSLAIAAVICSGLGRWLTVAVIAVLLAHAAWLVCTRAIMVGASAVVRFVWQAEGGCEFQTRDGRFHTARITPGMLVTPVLTIVRLRSGRWRWRTLCIVRDAVSAETFRRLRVRLRLSSPANPPALLKRLVWPWMRERWNAVFMRRTRPAK
ncbi:MAG: hypothetical protein L0I62_07455 [Gammaproteobacteria bacterium]|nr:hypothetical protein [Gammaproteobacteria bacterium]